MARAGLGTNAWHCVWANDFSADKAMVYRRNWGGEELREGDIGAVGAQDLPQADLAWASFPCQDLSLAGDQSGIGQDTEKARTRSGTFWTFWRLMKAKRPPVIVLENVVGALTSNEGEDMRAICNALSVAEYSFGAMVMDAAQWVPQSRPRLFIVAVRRGVPIHPDLVDDSPSALWHPFTIRRAHAALSVETRRRWIWWRMSAPSGVVPHLEDLISAQGDQWVDWDASRQTTYILSLMSPRNKAKIEAAQLLNRRIVGTAYRRTRGEQQRAEVRFDGVAGCLRTAAGGSSRQIVVEVDGKRIRTRLLSPREAARLQGLPDDYWLPPEYNDAYNVVGDGLCVPVVSHLRAHLLEQLVQPRVQLATA